MSPTPLTAKNLSTLESTPSSAVLAHSSAKSTLPQPKLSLNVDFSPPSPPTTSASPTMPLPLSATATATRSVQPRERDGVLYSPNIDSIVKAFQEEGDGDKELLKAVLLAKAKEDERLAARDNLKAEQLRAATLLASQQAFYLQAHAAHAHYASLSPTTPDSPYHPSVLRPFPTPRTNSSESLSPPSHYIEPYDEKPRREKRKTLQGEEDKETSHERAMKALRARCQRNQLDKTTTEGKEKESRPRKKRFIAAPLSSAPVPSAPSQTQTQTQPPSPPLLTQSPPTVPRRLAPAPPLASAARFNNSASPPPSGSSLRMLLNASGAAYGRGSSAFRAETSDVRNEV